MYQSCSILLIFIRPLSEVGSSYSTSRLENANNLDLNSPDNKMTSSVVELDVYARFYQALDTATGPKLISISTDSATSHIPFFQRGRQSLYNHHLQCRARLTDALLKVGVLERDEPLASASEYGGNIVIPVTQPNDTQFILPNLIQDTFDPRDRSIFQTHRLTQLPDGRLALVPASTRQGDLVVCLAGSQVPYVLRPTYIQDRRTILDESIRQAFPRPNDFKSYAPSGCKVCHNESVSTSSKSQE